MSEVDGEAEIPYAGLVDLVNRYVPLTTNGVGATGSCPFHDDTEKSLRVGDKWRCLSCGFQERTSPDALGWLMAWHDCTAEEAQAKLAAGEIPEQRPVAVTPRRRPSFFGLKALAKPGKVWIHADSASRAAGKFRVPSRVHIGFIYQRPLAELQMLKDRQCILIPHPDHSMRRLADGLYAAGHQKVVWIDPNAAWKTAESEDEALDLAKAGMHIYAAAAVEQTEPKGNPAPRHSASSSNAAAAAPFNEGVWLPAPSSSNATPPELPAPSPAPSLSAVSQRSLSAAGAQQPDGVAPDTLTPPKPQKPPTAHPAQPSKGNGASGPPLTPADRVALQYAADTKAVLDSIVFTCIGDVQPEAVKWLWPGRIPLGELTMIVGDPGLGKSQICASLSSVVTNGGQWPVSRERCAVGSVLILSAEDNVKHTIRPRLDAAGADVRRCHTLQAIRRQTEIGTPFEGGFNLAEDLAKLSVLMSHLEDVRLVIIDPVSAYLGETDSHKNAEVRGMLAPLTTLAGKHNAAIILVSHLTKSQSSNALMRVQGSIAFAALCRAVWGVARDQDDGSRRLFMPLKNNLGEDKSGLAYGIEPYTLRADAPEPIPTSRIMWEAQAVEIGTEEAFGAALTHDERGDLDEVKDFLREALSEGRVKASEVKRGANAAGHKDTTLGRAKRSLKVLSEREGFGAGAVYYWKLPAPTGD